MPQYHKVEQGDCIATIAAQYGFTDWRAIYDHPNNAQLKRCRPEPNILLPGDAVFIPDKKEKNEARGTSKQHTFQLPGAKILVRLVLEDSDYKGYANKKYALTVGTRLYSGHTDSKGLIEKEVSVTARSGELKIWLDEAEADCVSLQLQIGSLDPVDTLSGAQGRLDNLGYYGGAVSGVMDEATATALKAFQAKAGLPTTGAIDAATQAKLREFHDRL